MITIGPLRTEETCLLYTSTVILSTHLIEDVENFVGRAVLLHKGKVIGDLNVEEIRESGRTLVELIKMCIRDRFATKESFYP